MWQKANGTLQDPGTPVPSDLTPSTLLCEHGCLPSFLVQCIYLFNEYLLSSHHLSSFNAYLSYNSEMCTLGCVWGSPVDRRGSPCCGVGMVAEEA